MCWIPFLHRSFCNYQSWSVCGEEYYSDTHVCWINLAWQSDQGSLPLQLLDCVFKSKRPVKYWSISWPEEIVKVIWKGNSDFTPGPWLNPWAIREVAVTGRKMGCDLYLYVLVSLRKEKDKRLKVLQNDHVAFAIQLEFFQTHFEKPGISSRITIDDITMKRSWSSEDWRWQGGVTTTVLPSYVVPFTSWNRMKYEKVGLYDTLELTPFDFYTTCMTNWWWVHQTFSAILIMKLPHLVSYSLFGGKVGWDEPTQRWGDLPLQLKGKSCNIFEPSRHDSSSQWMSHDVALQILPSEIWTLNRMTDMYDLVFWGFLWFVKW